MAVTVIVIAKVKIKCLALQVDRTQPHPTYLTPPFPSRHADQKKRKRPKISTRKEKRNKKKGTISILGSTGIYES